MRSRSHVFVFCNKIGDSFDFIVFTFDFVFKRPNREKRITMNKKLLQNLTRRGEQTYIAVVGCSNNSVWHLGGGIVVPRKKIFWGESAKDGEKSPFLKNFSFTSFGDRNNSEISWAKSSLSSFRFSLVARQTKEASTGWISESRLKPRGMFCVL